MKRIWVALVLLLLCFCTGLFEYSLVNKNKEKFSNILDNAQVYISNKEYNKAYDMCKYALVKWKNETKTLNAFLTHSDVEEISDSLSLLCFYAQSKDSDEFSLVLGTTKRQLLSLKESELPLLENIL